MREFVESREGMEQLLAEMTVGFLGLDHDGTPYVVPVNYAYVGGRILFHCGLTGAKLDAIASNPAVCFTVARQRGGVARHSENVCHPDSESVVCRGTARVVDDLAARTDVLNEFNRSFRPDASPISPEDAAGCAVVEIVLSEMTGRREQGREVNFSRYRFH